MFFLTRSLLGLPYRYLLWMGTPFKYNNESSLKNIPVSKLKADFNDKKGEHYGERIALTVGLTVAGLVILISILSIPRVTFAFFVILMFICLACDTLLAVGRWVFFTHEEKAAEGRNEIVVADVWKDSSLEELLKRKKESDEEYQQNKNNGLGVSVNKYQGNVRFD